jgi:hypothetical protein
MSNAIHFIAEIHEEKIVTACGRDGYNTPLDNVFIHEYHCAKFDQQVEILAVLDGPRVTCRVCINRMIE